MASVYFLNMDLDLESTDDLSLVLAEFGENVILLNHDKGKLNRVSLELLGATDRPDDLLLEYGKLVAGFTDNAKLLWDRCSKKEFDIGFECEGEAKGAPIGLTEYLSTESIAVLLRLNATLAMTIYLVPEESKN